MKSVPFLLLLILPTFSYPQKIGTGLVNIYKSVGMISFLPTPNQRSFDTGTLVYKNRTANTLSIFLITCKHVLPLKSQSKIMYFDIANDKSPTKFSTILINVYDSLENYLPEIKIDPDSNDLAVINVTRAFAQENLRNIVNTVIPYDMIMTKDSIELNHINVGDDIFFIGIPSAFYDKRNISPILRAGVISSPPEGDFYFNDLIKGAYINRFHEHLPDKLTGFLIDANANGGSSGRIVFLKPQFIRINDGQLEYARDGGGPFILGVLAFSYLDLSPTVDPIKINLGGVISGGAIKKTIDLFKAE